MNTGGKTNKYIWLVAICALTLVGVQILAHVLPYFETKIAAQGMSLVGEWDFCEVPASQIKKDSDFSSVACKFRPIIISPSNDTEEVKFDSGYYMIKRAFVTPSFCLQRNAVCSLVIGEILGAQKAIINGVVIGEHGDFNFKANLRHPYPLHITIPNKLLNINHKNEIKIVTHSIQRALKVIIRRYPFSILPHSVALIVVQTLIAEVVFLPVVGGVGLLLMAIYGLVGGINFSSNVKAKIWIHYSLYCFVTGLFLFSTSRIPRSMFLLDPYFQFNYILRFTSDLLFLNLINSVFRINKKVLFLSRSVFCFVVCAIVLTVILDLSPKSAFDSTLFITKIGAVFVVLPVLAGCISILKALKKDISHKITAIVLIILFPMLVSDILNFFELISAPFYIRIYPFFIGVVFLNLIQNEWFQSLKELSVSARIGEISEQVVHDLQSPLSVLEVIQTMLGKSEKEVNSALNMAIKRIQVITADLSKNRQGLVVPQNSNLVSLKRVIEDVISQKELEFKHLGVRFSGVSTTLEDARAEIEETKLLRVLSNLINNSVEAQAKNITLKLGSDNGHFLLSISDDGKGIPKDIVEKLGSRRMSFDKRFGQGLGLYYAQSVLQESEGDLSIDSTLGKGTVISLKIKMNGVVC